MMWNPATRGYMTLFEPLQSRLRVRAFLVLIALIFNGGCANQATYFSQDSLRTLGGTPPVMVITSPSHPETYIVGTNDKLSQSLQWDTKTQTLVVYVTYSLVSGGGDAEMDPANYKTFELPFPTVGLDQKSNFFALTGQNKKVLVGRLEGGIFGSQVILNHNARLIAHRHNDELSAKLIVSEK